MEMSPFSLQSRRLQSANFRHFSLQRRAILNWKRAARAQAGIARGQMTQLKRLKRNRLWSRWKRDQARRSAQATAKVAQITGRNRKRVLGQLWLLWKERFEQRDHMRSLGAEEVRITKRIVFSEWKRWAFDCRGVTED